MKVIAIFAVVAFVAFEQASADHRISFYNHCPFDLWIGALNNPGKALPNKGGWFMKAYQTYDLTVSNGWAGRFWGRTQCGTVNGQFSCVTGDCGHRAECQGAGGVPPATLAEITFDGWQNLDYYDVSLVDGYNLPISMEPVGGTYQNGVGLCKWCGCNKDLNQMCPEQLRVYNSDHWPVACKSACEAFNEDRYCCRNQYDCSPHAGSCPAGKTKCDPATWPTNYAAIFKSACPAAYSYAYDDPSSTFTCRGNPQTNFKVTLCP